MTLLVKKNILSVKYLKCKVYVSPLLVGGFKAVLGATRQWPSSVEIADVTPYI